MVPGLAFFLVGWVLEETTTAVLGWGMWALSLGSISLLKGADAIVTGVAYSSGLLGRTSRRTIVFDREARLRGMWFLVAGTLFLATLLAGIVAYSSFGP